MFPWLINSLSPDLSSECQSPYPRFHTDISNLTVPNGTLDSPPNLSSPICSISVNADTIYIPNATGKTTETLLWDHPFFLQPWIFTTKHTLAASHHLHMGHTGPRQNRRSSYPASHPFLDGKGGAPLSFFQVPKISSVFLLLLLGFNLPFHSFGHLICKQSFKAGRSFKI